MVQPADKKPRGRPKLADDSEEVIFSIPKHHFDYLRHLSETMRRFGNTPNEAAKFILVRELDLMFRSDFHKKEIE